MRPRALYRQRKGKIIIKSTKKKKIKKKMYYHHSSACGRWMMWVRRRCRRIYVCNRNACWHFRNVWRVSDESAPGFISCCHCSTYRNSYEHQKKKIIIYPRWMNNNNKIIRDWHRIKALHHVRCVSTLLSERLCQQQWAKDMCVYLCILFDYKLPRWWVRLRKYSTDRDRESASS